MRPSYLQRIVPRSFAIERKKSISFIPRQNNPPEGYRFQVLNSVMANIFSRFAFFCLFILSTTAETFNVRHHLSTVTTYNAAKEVSLNTLFPSNIPNDCIPIHLNLVARHGTRSPTKKRMRELDLLEAHLKILIQNAVIGAGKSNFSLQNIPQWLQKWRSPWKAKQRGGELLIKGENELYELGIRIRDRFPILFEDEYHPDIYTIKTTQIPRASASAVAFGIGLFSGKGNLVPGHHRAFSVSSESRASDTLLRFHDTCENYKDYRKRQEPAVEKLKESTIEQIAVSLRKHYGLNFTRQDVSLLWFLCKQEASILEITDQACALFNQHEVALLEWTDDIELFLIKGYGKTINYRMGLPLLEDILRSMDTAIKAKEEKHPPGSFEKVRLRFAHAETLVPFSCLLGLFIGSSELEQIRREQPLELPPKPPLSRRWMGSLVAPFAGNNMLVLYSCPAKNSSKYYVQVLHNENPIPMPGCGNSDICSFEVFKEKVVGPHLRHDYNQVCSLASNKVAPPPSAERIISVGS